MKPTRAIETTIVVPAYKEELGLPIVLKDLLKVVDGRYEIIVVDDGSTDRTAEVAAQFPIKLIKHEVNLGKGEALKTGIKNASGENIIFIDSDGTYPASAIPKMSEAMKTYDMVYGSRLINRQNIPRFNRVGNAIFCTMIKVMYGFKLNDYCTGLYGLKKRHLEMMNLTSKRFAIEPEISIKGSRMGLSQMEIPIEYGVRVGIAKLSAVKAGYDHLKTILKLFLWQPREGRKAHVAG